MIINKSEAVDLLKPFLPRIHNVVIRAIGDFQSDTSRAFFCSRTKSSMINDLMIKNLLIEFTNTDGIRFISKHGCTYIIIRDRFAMRFKKFNKKLATSNIRTKQSNDFLNQRSRQFELDFPIMPPTLTNVFAGYTWNQNSSTASGIFITCPNGNKNEWGLELFAEQVPVAEVIPFNSEGRRKPVKPKEGNKHHENIDNN